MSSSRSGAGSIFAATSDGVRVRVRVTPRASRESIEGCRAEADGSPVLVARVTAAPTDGKANAALIHLLARAWDVPPSRLAVTAGAGDRRKTVLVRGDAAGLLGRLSAWERALADGTTTGDGRHG